MRPVAKHINALLLFRETKFATLAVAILCPKIPPHEAETLARKLSDDPLTFPGVLEARGALADSHPEYQRASERYHGLVELMVRASP